jgi:hypothetical protein
MGTYPNYEFDDPVMVTTGYVPNYGNCTYGPAGVRSGGT